MPTTIRRRRLVALLTLVATGLSARAALAQGDKNGILLSPPDNMPDSPNEPVSVDIGNWRVTSLGINSHLIIPDGKASVTGWTTGEGDKRRGGGAALTLDYWGDYGGQGRLWQGTLTIGTVGNYDPASGNAIADIPTRVLADGVEVAALTVGTKELVDMPRLFGADLAQLVPVQRLTVTMRFDGEEHVVYDVALPDTDAAFARAHAIPDYRVALDRRDHPVTPDQPSDSGTGDGSCFITTACCELFGLGDDCFELTSLRRFRDRVMAATDDGRRDIALYYDTAPRVLAEMARRGETHRLLPLYVTHILPSAVLARFGLRNLPRRLYTDMMRRMIARYLGGSA